MDHKPSSQKKLRRSSLISLMMVLLVLAGFSGVGWLAGAVWFGTVLASDDFVKDTARELTKDTIPAPDPFTKAPPSDETAAAEPKPKSYAAPAEMLDVRFAASGNLIKVPGKYPSIQKAIDAAEPGNVVMIAPGDYVGDIRLKEGVTLAARKPGTVTLDGTIGFANGIRLINLTFVNARIGYPLWQEDELDDWEVPESGSLDKTNVPDETPDAADGIRDVQILMCRFRGREATTDCVLLRLDNVTNASIHGCVFSSANVRSHGMLFGTMFRRCENLSFQGNTVADLHEHDWGNAVCCYFEQCSGIVANNLIVDSSENDWDSVFGMLIVQPRDLAVRHNTIANLQNSGWDSTFGISIRGKGACRAERNLVYAMKGPGWTAPLFGIHSDNSDPVILDNNVCRLVPDASRLEMHKPYVGTGGAINHQLNADFNDDTYQLSGPKQLLHKDGTDRIGVYAGAPLTVTLPECLK